jgi:hypothetical protein
MKHLYLRFALPAVFSAAVLFSAIPAVYAQSSTAHAVLDKGVKATGLTGADMPAWHIKADYTLYDPGKGTVTGSGTLEEWSTGPWTWHRVYTEKKLSGSEWSVSHTKQFKFKENKLDVLQLDQKVAIPLTDSLFQAANFKPDVAMEGQAGKLNDAILNCVNAADSAKAASSINPDLLYPRFCFDVKDSTLRYITTSNTIYAYTEFKPFGTRSVATKLEVKPYTHLGTSVVITLLEPLSAADQAQVAPAPKTIPQPWAHQPGDTPLVPVKITECAFPMAARNNREFGMIFIPVVIKKDGSVKLNGGSYGAPELHDLADAANDCVGNWKFQPFIMDGEAVDVSDTLSYNFDLKGFSGKIGIASQPPPPPVKP